MVKLIVPLLNLLVVLFLQMFPGDVSVNMDVPSRVDAGSEFDVKITFNKGDLEGFSRFQQNIPAGLTAISGTSSNADFTFTDKRVRLIWLKIPKSEEVTVTYRVKVDEKLKGIFTLTGKFSYIDKNERKSMDIDPVEITIVPSPSVDPSLIVDVNEYDKMNVPATRMIQPDASGIVCIRQKPYAGNQGEYIVKVLVNKGNMHNFAKIEEDIPEGYTAVALDKKDAIFTSKAQKAKFLWMNLPMENYFTVSYRLIPKNQAKLPAPACSGAFSYLVEEETISVPIMESNADIASLGPDRVSALIAQVASGAVIEQNVTPNAGPDLSITNNNTGTPASKPTRTRKAKKTESNRLARLEPEQGVYYRIQLAAGHKAVNVLRYFNKLDLEKDVRLENHNGWQKYSVGSFAVYKEARDYRIHIWNTTPVKDAFVTAYNSGERITIQEALMVTEQQWYQ